MKLVTILLGLLITNLLVRAATSTEEAKAFFNTYTNLSAKFDPAVADLYADDAMIKNKRHLADGGTREMTMQAPAYKNLVRSAMPLAKQRGDTNRYTEVAYKEEDGKVRITSTRYSELKKYSSPFTMVIAKRGDKWLIVEEESESKQ
ncbi:MAG: hypothetical protein ACXW32_13600 [Limisphaerales bacterium]